MSLGVVKNVFKENQVKKIIFDLKPTARNGLVLNIHHTRNDAKIRFLQTCFDKTGQILASADNDGNIFVVDLVQTKFWGLPKIDSCSIIKFSESNKQELLIGSNEGVIYLIDINTGSISGKLIGHQCPITSISFTNDNLVCLSSSHREAIVWDVETNSKIQVLNLETNTNVKFVVFMPFTNNILACYQDDVIQIWKYSTFETVKQFLPSTWNNYGVRNIAFSRNGSAMVVACYAPTLALFNLNNWKLSKLIKLPDHIMSVKHAHFIPESFDGGCNKILGILSGQGIIYFYNIDQNFIISELSCNYEINKFCCSSKDHHIACVLRSGDVDVYNISQYISPPTTVKVQKAQVASNKVKPASCSSKMGLIKGQMDEILETDKLLAILKEFGQYPEAHRIKIWEKLLQIPGNKEQYNCVINHVSIVAFDNLYTEYPLENKSTVKSLRMLLNNLVSWCPFFAQVEYLPVFAYPFVKVFLNKPLRSFEAMCTIIINWCQHWFEYFPLPPVNVLAIIENVILEHDPELLHYLSSYNITPNLYIWPLLETAFSEILTANEWLQFWDHVLSNEPGFLLCAVASYNILHRSKLLSFTTLKEFEFFYHNQNPNDIKSFLAKTYYILNNTSKNMHPRQYLNLFTKIDVGKYPNFVDYPKTIIDCQAARFLDKELKDLELSETNVIKSRVEEWQKIKQLENENEENTRLIEMEKACLGKLLSKQEKVQKQREKLKILRQAVFDEEQKILKIAQQKLREGKSNEHEGDLDMLLGNLDINTSENNVEDVKDKLLLRYSELLKHKFRVEQLLQKDDMLPSTMEAFQVLQQHQQVLSDEVEKAKKSLNSEGELKKLNITTGIAVMEDLIQKVKVELDNELSQKNLLMGESRANMRLYYLQAETKALEKEVLKLLKLLTDNRPKNSWELS